MIIIFIDRMEQVINYSGMIPRTAPMSLAVILLLLTLPGI
jgi:hypothetical protein